MAKGDEEKTAFFTREGVFYYKKLPFGLKNAGATYQRMIDRVLNNQIGHNLEVHVDDMEGPFLGHLITKKVIKANSSKVKILTDKPIKKILARPEKSGHIAKWTIELGEHDIEFRGCNSVKGQILADFLAETPSAESKEKESKETKNEEEEPKNMCKLYTDEASTSNGSGAGLMLISPKGKEYTYALRFEFDTTNNEAEY
ncbi:hypothetical protein Tco_1055809 [Tanacetum coccineum]|uniref:Reverse transcriptase domain-containing protein n=1 Tax=Tanacetum coccineum TaxID=301880 RepID=A0ABQ5H0Q7_9ASTR